MMSPPRLEVSAFTASPESPARRLRIAQHVEPLAALGIDVAEHLCRLGKYAEVPRPLRRALGRAGTALWQGAKVAERVPFALRSRRRIAWLEREIIPGRITIEPILGRPLVVDVDDAIWLAPGAGRSTARIARLADVVIAGSTEIANYYERKHARRIVQIPTAVDTERFRPAPQPPSRFTLGWIGSRSNLRYLEAIEIPLARFLREVPDARLLVVCDAPPSLPSVPAEQLEFRPWSESREADDLHAMSVGLMPLPDDEWTRAKCASKMLLYMAGGIPAVVSPVGTAAEILAMGEVGVAAETPDRWLEAIHAMARGGDAFRDRFGREGRRIAADRFSLPVITPTIAAVFRSLQ